MSLSEKASCQQHSNKLQFRCALENNCEHTSILNGRHPVSDLPCWENSEKVALGQLKQYLKSPGSLEPIQFSLGVGHSPEMVLRFHHDECGINKLIDKVGEIAVVDDLLRAVVKSQVFYDMA